MHEIVTPVDLTFSNQGPEWHGLAIQVPEITTEVVQPILFDIRERKLTTEVEGVSYPVDGYKVLLADLRHREELAQVFAGQDESGEDMFENKQMMPLHISRDSYRAIGNRDLWEMTQAGLKGVNCSITSAGTLGGAKYFYTSAQIEGEEGFEVNGDKFQAFFNVITSHNGTMAVEAYDSFVRIVCMNTLKWSRSSKGEIDFKVYHTRNAHLAISNLGEVINQILTGRADFVNQMGYLASVGCSGERAMNLVAGWMAQSKGKGFELSTHAKNRIDEIALLFANGKGNNGKTLYDLLNGVTEYFTHGSGTGKKATQGEKWSKSEFGNASENKRDFCNFLMMKDALLQDAEALGRELIRQYFTNKA